MRPVCIVIVGFFCGLALTQYLGARIPALPSGEVLVDQVLSLREHALVNACESTLAESEEETVANFDTLQVEVSAPRVAAERGRRQRSSPRELLHTLHRLQI
jgi:hypothetical protein